MPTDNYFLENGILTLRASRRALCIDPEDTALNWIKQRESNNNLKMLSFDQFDFMEQLVVAISMGHPVIVQNVDDYIDPRLDDLFTFQPNCKYR